MQQGAVLPQILQAPTFQANIKLDKLFMDIRGQLWELHGQLLPINGGSVIHLQPLPLLQHQVALQVLQAPQLAQVDMTSLM